MSFKGHIDEVMALIEKGANVNQTDKVHRISKQHVFLVHMWGLGVSKVLSQDIDDLWCIFLMHHACNQKLIMLLLYWIFSSVTRSNVIKFYIPSHNVSMCYLSYMMDANTLFLVLEGVDFSVYDNHVVCTGGWVVGMFIGCFNYLFLAG